MRHRGILALGAAALVLSARVGVGLAAQTGQTPKRVPSPIPQRALRLKPILGASKVCIDCHESMQPGIVAPVARQRPRQGRGRMLRMHGAESGRADAFDHYGTTMRLS